MKDGLERVGRLACRMAGDSRLWNVLIFGALVFVGFSVLSAVRSDSVSATASAVRDAEAARERDFAEYLEVLRADVQEMKSKLDDLSTAFAEDGEEEPESGAILALVDRTPRVQDPLPELPASFDAESCHEAVKEDGASSKDKVRDYILAMSPGTTQETAEALAESFVKWSAHYDVPLRLAVGVAHVESTFRPDAVGIQTPSGRALGSMQVMYGVHKNLLASEGLAAESDVLSVDGGVRAGCLLLGRYIRAEKSVTSALGRYFSRLDSNYILRKVLASSLTFEQFRSGLVAARDIKAAHDKETKTMGLLVSYPNSSAPRATAPKPKSGSVTVRKKPGGYARISLASPPKEMTVFKGN